MIINTQRSIGTTTCTNYYDDIDNEIVQTDKGTIVFEDNSLAPKDQTVRSKTQLKTRIPINTNNNTHTHTNTNTITKSQNPTATEKVLDFNPTEAAEMAQTVLTFAKLFDEDTFDYIYGTLLEDP